MEEKLPIRSPTLKVGNVTYCWNDLLEGYTSCPTENPEQSVSTGEKIDGDLLIHSMQILSETSQDIFEI